MGAVTVTWSVKDIKVHKTKSASKNVLSNAKKFNGYRWQEEVDPDMYVALALLDASPYSDAELAELAGISEGTITNWRFGTTKRPTNRTLSAVAEALGAKRQWTLADGTPVVIPGVTDATHIRHHAE